MTRRRIPTLIIAGTGSGAGKTTLAVAFMAACIRRGLRVAPFKVGPDYLDPGYHRAACGRPSGPLDVWMMGEDGLKDSFERASRDADIAIVEGMMGLYDGASPDTDLSSTAQVAKLLDAPVVLAFDASAMARSAGALVLGYKLFDPNVRLAGAVANRVSGEGHAAFLRPAIADYAGVPWLGRLPDDPACRFPERHLGLRTAGEQADLDTRIQRLADLAEAHLEIEEMLAIAGCPPPRAPHPPAPSPAEGRRGARKILNRAAIPAGVGEGRLITKGDVPLAAVSTAGPPTDSSPYLNPTPLPAQVGSSGSRIAVAWDNAFCFYYPDNLALLKGAGAEIAFFSPLADGRLPEGTAGVYLGGGYPELHAERLSGNAGMRQALREAASGGVPIYAECGGFMALCESLTDADGRKHAMMGLLPGRVTMESSLQAIGYREVTFARDTPLARQGTVARGHEFRYSRHEPGDSTPDLYRIGEHHAGYARGSVVGSYIHLHFGSHPGLAAGFVRACRQRARRK
jgi:cobyrinic acid a,c-diamide synthase